MDFIKLCKALHVRCSNRLQHITTALFNPCAGGNAAMVTMTKRPELFTEAEAEVRRTLRKRYDLCASTYVHTTTLPTAAGAADSTRWTGPNQRLSAGQLALI